MEISWIWTNIVRQRAMREIEEIISIANYRVLYLYLPVLVPAPIVPPTMFFGSPQRRKSVLRYIVKVISNRFSLDKSCEYLIKKKKKKGKNRTFTNASKINYHVLNEKTL